MDDVRLEAMIIAAAHLYHRAESGEFVFPKLDEVNSDEFKDVVGRFRALVDHYEMAIKHSL